jgi:nickel-dependent lactate racemase
VCEPGRLIDNPVAEEIGDAADLRPPDVAVCLVPGIDGGVAEAVAGPWRESFAAAVARVRAMFEVSGGNFDLVVASGGGAPSDETLIQAHKGLDAACRFARTGAEVLFLASMAGGPGSDAIRPFLADPRPDVILKRLAGGWVQYGHTTYRLVEKTSRHRVSLVTEAEWEGLDGLGFQRVVTADETIERWRDQYPGATVGVMTGPAVYPRRS